MTTTTLTYDPDRSCYDTVCAAIDEAWLADQPWNMYSWHPDGAHFESCAAPVAVVVTDWTDANYYDVVVYDVHPEHGEDWMDHDVAACHVPTDLLPFTLQGVLTNAADMVARHRVTVAPAPITADMLAHHYLTVVRANGMWAVTNVAECNDAAEIAMEIDESWNNDHPDHPLILTDDDTEHGRRSLAAAARHAIDVCRIECGRFEA